MGDTDELAEARRFVREGRRREYSRGGPSSAGNWGRMCGLPMMPPGPRSSTGTGYTSGFRTAGGVWPSVCPMSPARSTSSPRRGFQPCRAALHVPLRAGAVRRSVAACRCLVRQGGALQICPVPGAGLAGTTCGWRRWILRPESLSGASAAGRRSRAHAAPCQTGLSRYIRYSPGGITAWESPSRGGAFPYVSCSRGAGS